MKTDKTAVLHESECERNISPDCFIKELFFFVLALKNFRSSSNSVLASAADLPAPACQLKQQQR
jgi:hypothetical protein